MRDLIPLAERAAALLKARGQTIAVAESAAGGLISASLLAVPGASAYFIGGGVFYTRRLLLALRDVRKAEVEGVRGATESWALYLARTVRSHAGADWAVAESGAAGPAGNRYGDPAGHAALAVAGARERTQVIETGSSDRTDNMRSFAAATLILLAEVLE